MEWNLQKVHFLTLTPLEVHFSTLNSKTVWIVTSNYWNSPLFDFGWFHKEFWMTWMSLSKTPKKQSKETIILIENFHRKNWLKQRKRMVSDGMPATWHWGRHQSQNYLRGKSGLFGCISDSYTVQGWKKGPSQPWTFAIVQGRKLKNKISV